MTWEQNLEEIVRRETNVDACTVWKSSPDAIPFNYRFEHTLAVVSTAKYLQRKEGGDYRIIVAAAWLHDIAKQFESTDDAKVSHGLLSAQRAGDILSSRGFSKDEIQSVQEAIETHVGLFQDTIHRSLEADILWDADKLTKVGAVSIGHAFAIAPAFGSMTTEILIKRGMHWLTLAEQTVGAFKTTSARQLGKSRLAFLKNFYQRLEIEFTMEGPDAAGN